MIGSLNLPIQIDDAATRDELANLRLQTSAIVTGLTGVISSLAVVASGLADVKSGGSQILASVENLSMYVATVHDATRQTLAQILSELAVLRELVPDRKPTMTLHLSVRNKEQK